MVLTGPLNDQDGNVIGEKLQHKAVTLIKRSIGGFGVLVKYEEATNKATISHIVKGSAAEEDGQLHVGDIIYGINGETVPKDFEKVLDILTNCAVGSTIIINVLSKELKSNSGSDDRPGSADINQNQEKVSRKEDKVKRGCLPLSRSQQSSKKKSHKSDKSSSKSSNESNTEDLIIGSPKGIYFLIRYVSVCSTISRKLLIILG